MLLNGSFVCLQIAFGCKRKTMLYDPSWVRVASLWSVVCKCNNSHIR